MLKHVILLNISFEAGDAGAALPLYNCTAVYKIPGYTGIEHFVDRQSKISPKNLNFFYQALSILEDDLRLSSDEEDSEVRAGGREAHMKRLMFKRNNVRVPVQCTCVLYSVRTTLGV
jgi:hypothetical protein